MSNIDKLNDHELVDLKNAIEESLNDALMGQSHRIMSSPASLMLRILLIWTTPYVGKSVTEDAYGWVAESTRKPVLRQSCTGIVGAKTPSGDESRSLQHVRSEKYFKRGCYPPGNCPIKLHRQTGAAY